MAASADFVLAGATMNSFLVVQRVKDKDRAAVHCGPQGRVSIAHPRRVQAQKGNPSWYSPVYTCDLFKVTFFGGCDYCKVLFAG